MLFVSLHNFKAMKTIKKYLYSMILTSCVMCCVIFGIIYNTHYWIISYVVSVALFDLIMLNYEKERN